MWPTKIIFNDNEIILKEILPRKRFFFNTTEKIRIVFSFFYLAISLVLIFSGSPVLFFGIIAFSVGLYLAFFRWVLRYFDVKNNCYLITNQRIIIAERKSHEIKKEKLLADTDQINAEMNGSFFGNIIFGETEGIFGRNDEPFSFLNRSGMSFKENEYTFLSVENINEIITVFERLGLRVTKTFY